MKKRLERQSVSFFSGKIVVSAVVLFVVIIGIVSYVKKITPVALGLNVELSGDLANVGMSSKNGAELAVNQINANGGVNINGGWHKLKLIVMDNQSSPNGARAATNNLNDEHVAAMIGPNASAYAIPAADAAEQASLPMLSPWSTSPQTTLLPDGQFKQFVFRTAFIDPFQGKALAEFALKNLGAKRAVVLYDKSAEVLKGQANYFSDVFSTNGGQCLNRRGLHLGKVNIPKSYNKF